MTVKPGPRKNAPSTKSSWTTQPAILAVILVGVAIVGLLYFRIPQDTGSTVPFKHMHGLGFSADGQQLFVPAHEGFVVYQNGRWDIPGLPAHDYMGYSAVDDGFYSSGHPAPGSNLVNPLGLIRSIDGGETFMTLSFEGLKDFHLMSVGYRNHAIYLLNELPFSGLPLGLNFSLNEGQNWTQSRSEGISGGISQIAVHPIDIRTVAIATESGLYLSDNYGDTFTSITEGGPVTAAAFDPDGDRLLFGYQTLNSYDMKARTITPVQSPDLANDDAIGFIALYPASDELAFATYNKNIYLSRNGGQTWQQLAVDGVGRSAG